MMSFARGSFLNEPCHILAAVIVFSTLAPAQHPSHAPVAPVHVSPPPIYHAPVIQTPIPRPPVIYAPRYTPVPVGVVSGRLATTVVRPPVRPVRPIRPITPVFFVYSPQFLLGEPFWALNSCWWTSCDLFWPWITGYTSISSPGPMNYSPQVSETPVYVYGGEREDFPQLFLKDGTILNVTDYWVVDGQLHFKIIEELGQKPLEQSIPFEALDLQKTVDVNTDRGFRFLLRNEPFEEYVRDHPEGPPPAFPPQHQ